MKLLLRRACPCCWHDKQQYVLSLCSAVSVFFAPMRIPVRIDTMTLERNIFPPKWCMSSKVVIIISHHFEINQAKTGWILFSFQCCSFLFSLVLFCSTQYNSVQSFSFLLSLIQSCLVLISPAQS